MPYLQYLKLISTNYNCNHSVGHSIRTRNPSIFTYLPMATATKFYRGVFFIHDSSPSIIIALGVRFAFHLLFNLYAVHYLSLAGFKMTAALPRQPK